MRLTTNRINQAISILEQTRETALAQLRQLDYQTRKEKYFNVPDFAITKSKLDDSTTNGLTECVIRWLHLNGHYCSRIQSQGQYNPTLQRWTKSTVKRGIGDILAVVNSKTVMIEVKVGQDRQSPAQKETQNEVEESGGYYFIAKDFESFLKFYTNKLTEI